jgi:serine/threonine protein kinase
VDEEPHPRSFKKSNRSISTRDTPTGAIGNHSQIPTLQAHFEQNQYLYLVQEYIDGTNLARVVEEEGTFSEAQIWQLLDDLLPVLKFIHNHQVIHRDIKPEISFVESSRLLLPS